VPPSEISLMLRPLPSKVWRISHRWAVLVLVTSIVGGLVVSAMPIGTASASTSVSVGVAADPNGGGWATTAQGAIQAFGGAPNLGSIAGLSLNQPVVGIAATPDGGGYWLATSDGGIFSFGDAKFFGSTGSVRLNKPVVGIAATPDGGGYWLAASDGGIFSFGDAKFFGSTGSVRLNKPVVGIAATPDGGGYWLAASDGGVFSFGDAAFYGSMGGMKLNKPIVGIAAAGATGYWLAAADGGIFNLGSATFAGSAATGTFTAAGMAPFSGGSGYYMIGSNGRIMSFGISLPHKSAPSTTSPSSTTPPPPTTTTSSAIAPSSGSSSTVSVASQPVLGVLNVSGGYFSQERAAGVRSVTINVGWQNAEPEQGVFNRAYLSLVTTQIVAARAQGFSVVLDPGLQYAPSWVFALPGQTRFIDQYGDAFGGTADSGNNVPNGVTNTAVRAAEGAYLQGLANGLPAGSLSYVRAGGGADGELRYPDPTYNGHSNLWWAYDAQAQAASPVPGWVPGSGTPEEAASFLAAYNQNLIDYGAWLVSTTEAAFNTKVLLLLPGWGERPGVADEEANSLLTLGDDEFNYGADWAGQLAAVTDKADTVAYTTYLDGQAFDSAVTGEAPIAYLASLAVANGMAVGGENTGNGTVSTLEQMATSAKMYNLVIVNWMDEASLVAASIGPETTTHLTPVSFSALSLFTANL
jgi:hypothetical protein